MSTTKIAIFALLSLVYSDLLYSQAPNYAGSYEIIRKAQQSQFEYQKPGFTTADSLHDFDVIIYKLKLALNDHSIAGSSEIGFKSNINNLSVISLNYIEGTIDSIKSGGNILNYNRVSGILNVTLPYPIDNGDSAGLQIYYHTSPSKGFYWQTNTYNDAIWYSFAKPSEARYWFPCYDQPWDKALCDLEINVPANMYCISNGALIGQWPGPTSDRRTFHWRENYPISTYLISLGACNYAIISDTIQIAGSQLPLTYYVYHRDSIKAVNDFVNIPTMFQFYSNAFGAYGFLNEKYSISETKVFDGWGAMENQTATSLGDMLVTGNRGYEWIYAHELAHQWFGDLLTVIDWRNIWLSEGMATYLDALFTEYFYGETAFRDRLGNFKTSYLWEDRNDLRYAIFDPPEDHLFGAVEYEKAALVLHMLRFVCGDDVFFQAMRRYVAAFKYGNVSTDN
jgi:aminopeptidase N